jgi:hypothetical protein
VEKKIQVLVSASQMQKKTASSTCSYLQLNVPRQSNHQLNCPLQSFQPSNFNSSFSNNSISNNNSYKMPVHRRCL